MARMFDEFSIYRYRPPNLFNDPPRRLAPGRYRVTLEGTANANGAFIIDGCGSLPPATVSSLAARFERLPDPAPEWRPGDVIVFLPGGHSASYTYVRGARVWPGESAAPKTDAVINRWWREGKVKPVLQAGGVPFDPARLP